MSFVLSVANKPNMLGVVMLSVIALNIVGPFVSYEENEVL